jgi:hypothetical protein
MRAAAFCEQQAQRKFRTASADMRNRDVELVEEDFMERIFSLTDGFFGRAPLFGRMIRDLVFLISTPFLS